MTEDGILLATTFDRRLGEHVCRASYVVGRELRVREERHPRLVGVLSATLSVFARNGHVGRRWVWHGQDGRQMAGTIRPPKPRKPANAD